MDDDAAPFRIELYKGFLPLSAVKVEVCSLLIVFFVLSLVKDKVVCLPPVLLFLEEVPVFFYDPLCFCFGIILK